MSESYTVNDDQSYEVKRNDWAAQTFTPVETHRMWWLSLKVYGGLGHNYAEAEIRTTVGGIPTNTVLDSFPLWLDKIPQYPYGKLYRSTFYGLAVLEAGVTYAIVLRPTKMRWADKIYWRYDQGNATYPRGQRLSSNDEGETWTPHPGDDHMFVEWGKPPAPPPPPEPPELNFAALDMIPTLIPGGYSIRVATATPCHLSMFWTNIEPEKHTTPIYRRGLYLKDAIRYCFVNWHKNEQEEEGDTLYHTFYKCGWAHCEKRWFTFRATVEGAWSPSSTPIFSRHRIVPPEGVLGQNLIDPIPDNHSLTRDYRIAQSFTPHCSHKLLSLAIAMGRHSLDCDGVWNVQIRSNDDWHPSDTVLWQGELDVELFPIDSYSWFTFPIDSLPMIAGLPYWIVMWRTDYTIWYLSPFSKGNHGNVYTRGEFLYSYTGTSPWYAHGEGLDLAFALRGD